MNAPRTSTAPHAASAAPRLDLYDAIHKALRLFMTDTLVRVGRMDSSDPAETTAVLDQVDALLGACRAHVEKEDKFVHPAIEARRPGETARIAGEHVQHLEAIAELAAEAATLRAWPTASAALRLYRHLARFVGENLEHMAFEESQHNPTLWAVYSDAELLEVHQRILASIEPDEMAGILRWMLPAMTPAERAAMLGEMRLQLPAPAMQGVLEIARDRLDDGAWAKLARALGLAPAPGLVGR